MDNQPKKRTRTIKKNHATRAVVLTALFFIFMWNLDIAITTLMNGLTMYNGFFTANAAIMYHSSLAGLAFCFITTMFMKWE